jgi:alpha-ketoglutarate-dependent taurine dioxygenase
MVTTVQPDDERSYITLTADGRSDSLLDLDEAEVERLYKEHGAVLFRGFPFDVEIFWRFTGRFCSHFVFNEGAKRETIDKDNHVQSVNPGAKMLCLHPELAREPYKPDVCWFACVSPAQSGGETVICDGVQLAKKLPADVFEALNSRRLLYRRPATSEEISFWLKTDQPTDDDLSNPPVDCPYEFWRNDDKIGRRFSTPALHRPMFADDLAFGSFLLLARYNLNNKAFPLFEDGSVIPDDLVESIMDVAEDIKQPIKWQANDVLMLDNTRFMHGRNAIGDPENRNVISQFGYLKFAKPGPEEGPNARWRKPDGLSILHQQS